MSKRNTQANKAAARERLRAERERQAKKDKVRRQVIVGVSIVGVLAVVGGVTWGVMQLNKPSGWEAAKDAKNVAAPKNTSGKNGTTVVIGKSTAKKTLELYEDSRCPVCGTFEQSIGETVHKDVDAGKYKIKYIGATFIDGMAGGEGSKNALSALGAALDVSPEAFLDYKAALYSAKYHPEETDDKFKDDSYLIKVADSVDALKGNAAFQKNVKDGTFDSWAMKMSETFEKSGVRGTPTLKMDGKKLTDGQSENAPMTVEAFNTAITAALKG
ncbi:MULTISPECIES: DsbA family protein [unclassified Streptomyces]|uniref:DsbA family protein n=1 Tax=unclassified Streptomyces TaxID=2593676 RepID=UPI000F5C04B6|nr:MULTISPECIES: DsbA family protein [unclassified Streptomyces]MCX4397242.1 DsbA family protein [Streptomyces sp. NBC_01767]MCX5100055.1 DsbA family protein [Streptomyces sp. NBC_00439]RPK72226.1 Disulfide bond formation protein D precursor [Streptomyces sp. ADI95-17]WSG50270.1 DsbA family protein [Streptomyces sp. NBC_01732]